MQNTGVKWNLEIAEWKSALCMLPSITTVLNRHGSLGFDFSRPDIPGDAGNRCITRDARWTYVSNEA